jgi:hypothetical protein
MKLTRLTRVDFKTGEGERDGTTEETLDEAAGDVPV